VRNVASATPAPAQEQPAQEQPPQQEATAEQKRVAVEFPTAAKLVAG